MKIPVAIIALLALILCSGCGTIAGHDGLSGGCMSPMKERNMTGVYRGIRVDGGWLVDCFTHRPSDVIVLPLVLIDVPFSLGADTLVLPWDIADTMEYGEAAKE